jgi:hypothetical protein
VKPAVLCACAFAALCAAAACSSGKPDTSGVPRDAYMDELPSEQVTTFCAWGVQKQGGSGEHTCSWGTQKIMTIAECEAKKWPHCALATFEDCVNSLVDVCDQGPTSECTAYGTCAAAHPAAGRDAGVAGDDAGS